MRWQFWRRPASPAVDGPPAAPWTVPAPVAPARVLGDRPRRDWARVPAVRPVLVGRPALTTIRGTAAVTTRPLLSPLHHRDTAVSRPVGTVTGLAAVRAVPAQIVADEPPLPARHPYTPPVRDDAGRADPPAGPRVRSPVEEVGAATAGPFTPLDEVPAPTMVASSPTDAAVADAPVAHGESSPTAAAPLPVDAPEATGDELVVELPARPLRVVAAVEERPSLVSADETWLRDPVEAARPFTSVTSFERAMDAYKDMSLAEMMAMAGMGIGGGSSVAAPPSSAPPPPRPDLDEPAPHRTRRRPTLAESRRRGLSGGLPPAPPPAPASPAPRDDPAHHDHTHDEPREEATAAAPAPDAARPEDPVDRTEPGNGASGRDDDHRDDDHRDDDHRDDGDVAGADAPPITEDTLRLLESLGVRVERDDDGPAPPTSDRIPGVRPPPGPARTDPARTGPAGTPAGPARSADGRANRGPDRPVPVTPAAPTEPVSAGAEDRALDVPPSVDVRPSGVLLSGNVLGAGPRSVVASVTPPAGPLLLLARPPRRRTPVVVAPSGVPGLAGRTGVGFLPRPAPPPVPGLAPPHPWEPTPSQGSTDRARDTAAPLLTPGTALAGPRAPLVDRARETPASAAATMRSGITRLVTIPARPAVPAQEAAPPPAPVTVPPDLADMIEARWGSDVRDVVVDRGTAASDRARTMGARAFTEDARVVLPVEAGDLGGPTARGLLAHELVHVGQQRALGASLPPEHSPAGRALEAEARAAEALAGGRPAGHLVHPAPTVAASAPQEEDTAMSAGTSWTLAGGFTDAAAPVGSEAPEWSSISGSTPPPQDRDRPTGWEDDGSWYPAAAPGVQRAAVTGSPPAPAADGVPRATAARVEELAEQVATLSARVTTLERELYDAGALDRLAGRLYRHLRTRLRGELLVDRERSGRLADVQMRGTR